PALYEQTLRKSIAEVDPKLALIDVDSYTDQVAIKFNQERLLSRLTTLFGVLALLLASVGLYGVTAYDVARKTSEIGIRMALGADRRNVMKVVLKGAMKFTGVGLFIGVPIAILCGRLLHSQLYEVSQLDFSVLGASVIALSVCALVAAFVPARRAASVDPNQALRAE
ncbi:MAG TPA: FtsX-like permease family protein, partial [Terracidiphilus sp.]